ncbi:MAG: LemA family protein [Bacilli bacterium]
MKKSVIIAIVVVSIVLIIGGFFTVKYNSIVSKEEGVKTSESNIGTNLKRRADLIPNLVNTVKGYSVHEQSAIDSVTTAREKMVDSNNVNDKLKANDELSNSISKLMLIVENYPELKANVNFIQLQDELAGTENRIAVSRKDYNDSVQEYNSYIKKFPNNIIAKMFNFGTIEYFKADESVNEVPEVTFE